MRRLMQIILALAMLVMVAGLATAACGSVPADTEQSILAYVNAQRQANGLTPMTLDTSLSAIARAHSSDMVNRNYFSHTNPEGLGPTQRAERAGYNVRKQVAPNSYRVGIGENLGIMPTGNVRGYGYIGNDGDSVARALVTMWMNSPGHKANILNPQFDRIGIGVAAKGTWYYGTQTFF